MNAMNRDPLISLPTLLSEDEIRPFQYYWQDKIRSGMMLHGRIYAMLDCFPEDKRVIAYERGCKLAEKCEVVITASRTSPIHYRIWIGISSETDRLLLDQTPTRCGQS